MGLPLPFYLTPNAKIQVKMQPSYLTLGVDFCVYGPFYPTIKVAILQLRGTVEKNRKKTDWRSQEAEIRKESWRKKKVWQERGTPSYLKIVNLTAPVVPKTGGSFNFNPQCPTARQKKKTTTKSKEQINLLRSRLQALEMSYRTYRLMFCRFACMIA